MRKLKGYLVRIWKWILRKRFHFDKWHISSLDQRKYATDIISFANSRELRNSCLEIGCGLGDIVRNLHYTHRYGFDIDSNVLKAAKFISAFNKENKIEFAVFNFPADQLKAKYDLIIMVNWIHHIEPSVLHQKLAGFFNDHLQPSGEIIIDTVQDPDYEFNHNINFLTNGLNCSVSRLGEYPRQREIWAIKKSN